MTSTPEPDAGIAFEQTDCPLCATHKSRPYLSSRDLLYRTPGDFQLVRCVDCAHVYLNPRPAPHEMGRYYPPEYGPHHATGAEAVPPLAPSAKRGLKARLRSIPGLQRVIHRLVESRAEWIPPIEMPPRRAVELGCADGTFLERLRGDGWEASGVEPSAEAAGRARARGFGVFDGTLEAAAFPDSHFDALFAWMVLEHLHDPAATLREARRVLKPGGWLVLSVPNVGCWEPFVFGRYWHAFDLPRHVQHFTPRTLRRLLGDCGFSPPKIIHQRNLLNVIGSAGLCLRRWRAGSRCGDRLLRFVENPTAGGLLLLAPWARLLAAVRQGGRLTVMARSNAKRS